MRNEMLEISRASSMAALALGALALPMIFLVARPDHGVDKILLLAAFGACSLSVFLLFVSIGVLVKTIVGIFRLETSVAQRISLVAMVMNIGWVSKVYGFATAMAVLLVSMVFGLVVGWILKSWRQTRNN